jgi:hypothetical protein
VTTPEIVIGSISYITSELIKYGLSDSQNYPSKIQKRSEIEIRYSGFEDVSIALRNVDYKDIYQYLDVQRQFNIKMIDGGLLQLLYTFKNNILIKHRLCYFPSPSFQVFQNDPEIFLDESLIYADITQKSILPVPVRFDFAPEDAVPIDHPVSHMTLGQYKNCRIPVTSPICPSTFINFIIRSFYFNAKYQMPKFFDQFEFEKTLHKDEEKMARIAIF